MKTSHSFSALLLAALALGTVPPVPAQAPRTPGTGSAIAGQSRDMVRTIQNPDGTRSVYTSGPRTGLQCANYTKSGELAAIMDYKKGSNGVMLGCIVLDKRRNPIYKVAYGYDSKARLVEERMFSYSDKKLVQRIIYRYDASGNRSKPLIISLDTSAAKVSPTMANDANEINRSMNRGDNRRR